MSRLLLIFNLKINRLSQTMNESPTCPHCHQQYSLQNPPKQLINCSHSLCLKCLQELILCPQDRVRIQLRRFTLEAFKTNETLLPVVGKEEENHASGKRSHNSSKKSTPQEKGSNKSKNTHSSKKKTSPFQAQPSILISNFQDKAEDKQTPSPFSDIKNNSSPIKTEQRSSNSPKKATLAFQTCLLHSKKADLICMQDKCLICSGCGLFGEHKHHSLLPYDTFLAQYSTKAQECFKNYEQLQSRSDKMNAEIKMEEVSEMLTQKRGNEIKNIKNFVKQLTDIVKTVEKELISNLDVMLSYKKTKIQEYLTFQQLLRKRDKYMRSVDGMTLGLQDLFNLQHIEKYISFIDPNNENNYIQEEGEYLVRQIDNYCKNMQQKLQEETSEFSYIFQPIDSSVFQSFFSIKSCDDKQIEQELEKHRKNQQLKIQNQSGSKMNTPARGKNCKDSTIVFGRSTQKKESPVKQPEDNLLLQVNSRPSSPVKNQKPKEQKNLSPIHPLSNHQNFDCSSYSGIATAPEFFLKVAEPPLPNNSKVRQSTGKPSNKTQAPRMSYKKATQNNQNRKSMISIHPSSKPKSQNNSNNMTERELLNVLNQKSDNRRKKKLDLSEKYAKVYDDLLKDRVQIVDFGGAFLGDMTILAISELFPSSRGKVKQLKLMNNKISDEVFPELLYRCRAVPSLNLSYNNLTERCLEWLLEEANNLGQLRNITLSNNKIVLRNNKDRIQELKRRGLNVSL